MGADGGMELSIDSEWNITHEIELVNPFYCANLTGGDFDRRHTHTPITCPECTLPAHTTNMCRSMWR